MQHSRLCETQTKLPANSSLKRRPYSSVIIHKHPGIGVNFLNPFFRDEFAADCPSTGESAANRFRHQWMPTASAFGIRAASNFRIRVLSGKSHRSKAIL